MGLTSLGATKSRDYFPVTMLGYWLTISQWLFPAKGYGSVYQ